MSFDPDAYLAKKSQAFDPDAYLAKKAPVASQPAPSLGNRLLSAIGQYSTAARQGYNRGLGALGETLGVPKALSAAGLEPSQPIQQPVSPGILKKDSPDLLAAADTFVEAIGGPETDPGAEHRERSARFAQENPWATMLLGLAGGAARPVPIGPARSADATNRVAEALDKAGNSFLSRQLTGGVTPLRSRKVIPAEVLNEAYAQGAGRLGQTTHRAAEVLQDALERVGARQGEIIPALEASGVKATPGKALAERLRGQAEKQSLTDITGPQPGLFQHAADRLEALPENLSLSQVEEMKRNAQLQARGEYDKITRQYTPGGEAKKALASSLRQANEDAIAAQAALNPQAAADFVPLKQQYGRLAQASQIAEEGAARAARRGHVSLTDYLSLVHGGVPAMVANKALHTFGPGTGARLFKGSANLVRSPLLPELATRAGVPLTTSTNRLLRQAIIDELRQRPKLASADEEAGGSTSR